MIREEGKEKRDKRERRVRKEVENEKVDEIGRGVRKE